MKIDLKEQPRISAILKKYEIPNLVQEELEKDISHFYNKILAELEAIYKNEMIRQIMEMEITRPKDPDEIYNTRLKMEKAATKPLNEHQAEAIKSFKEVRKSIEKLSGQNNIEKIIEWIKIKNGWTSLAEFSYNQMILQSINLRISSIALDLQNVITSAKLINSKS